MLRRAAKALGAFPFRFQGQTICVENVPLVNATHIFIIEPRQLRLRLSAPSTSCPAAGAAAAGYGGRTISSASSSAVPHSSTAAVASAAGHGRWHGATTRFARNARVANGNGVNPKSPS